jgi:hypothetical protein
LKNWRLRSPASSESLGPWSPLYSSVASLQWLHLNALRQMLSRYKDHLSEELVIMISKSHEVGCQKSRCILLLGDFP